MYQPKQVAAVVLALVLLALAGCGGGGGGSSKSPAAADAAVDTPAPAPQPEVANQAPVAPDDTTVQLTDWEVYEGVLPGSDPDGDGLRFEIVSSFVPFQITDPATGAYRYDPLTLQKRGEVEYQVVDEHGAHDWGKITFLHATKPVLQQGECPIAASQTFDEPVADVWTHPDDSLLFIAFADGEGRTMNVGRYEIIDNGEPNVGASLEPTTLGGVVGAANELLVDPDDADVIYARIDARDLAVSHDTGRTFEYIDNPGYGSEIEDLAVTGTDVGYLWAVNATGIYRAPKDALAFSLVQPFADIQMSAGYTIAVHPDRPARLLVTGADGTYRTEDAGQSWTRVADAPAANLVVDPHDPDRVYGMGDWVYLSSDFGDSWTAKGYNGFNADRLVADPYRPGRLYAGPWDVYHPGLWVSNDEGEDFSQVEALNERVRGMAFASNGAMYVGQGNRVVCRPVFELPDADPNHPLAVEVRIEDVSSGQLVSEVPVQTPVRARMTITNRNSQPVSDVLVEAWLEAPGGRALVFSQPGTSVGVDGLELEFELPAPVQLGRHRLIASADLPTDAPSGALTWFVTSNAPAAPEPYVEYAELSANTLWLNYNDPWFPVVTEPGEQRRMVLDVDNKGPDTARNVVVRIATGTLIRVDQYGPIRIGQTLDCSSDSAALTCRLGDMPAGTRQSIELYVTMLRTITAVPVYLTSDTPSKGVPSGGLDLVTELSGPDSHIPGETIEYTLTVTNEGDETADSMRVNGAIGPWPAASVAHLVSFSDPACQIEPVFARDEAPLTYSCSAYFLQPGERYDLTIRIAAPDADAVIHVVEASGFPGSNSEYWYELFRGNNSRGVVSVRAD